MPASMLRASTVPAQGETRHNIMTCYLVSRQIICGFWILYLDLLDIHQAEFTLTCYSLNLTVITLLWFFTGWPPISFDARNANLLSCLRASAATNIHCYCIHYFELQLKTVFMLARTKLADFSAVTPVLTTVLHCCSVLLSLLVLNFSHSTGTALSSVSFINAGIWYAENAALCIIASDVTEVTWSLLFRFPVVTV
jgi:hypothetical protein